MPSDPGAADSTQLLCLSYSVGTIFKRGSVHFLSFYFIVSISIYSHDFMLSLSATILYSDFGLKASIFMFLLFDLCFFSIHAYLGLTF